MNGGVGVIPIEFRGSGDRDSLVEAYHHFRRLRLDNTRSEATEQVLAAFRAWGDALAPHGLTLHLERWALHGGPLPRAHWDVASRGISVRPWDIELTALDAGLRQVVKFDRVPPELAVVLRTEAERRGSRVETVVPPGGPQARNDAEGAVTLLIGREPSALQAARRLEERLLVGGVASAAEATLEMGTLLGYPDCCVERFAHVAAQNDTTLAWALLPGLPHPPASPLTQWLQPGLWLLSHFPCALDCAASVALGTRLLAAADAADRGFASRWHALAARVQVVDQWSNRLALAVEGTLEHGGHVTAADLLGAGGTDPDAASRAARMVGETVHADSGGLVIAARAWYAPYAADHRGESA